MRTKADYARATATINVLLDEVGDDEVHPLAEVLDYLAGQVKTYEDKHVLIPEAEPRNEVCAGCGNQSPNRGQIPTVSSTGRTAWSELIARL